MSEKRFGKSFGDLNSLKQNFFNNNDGMLKMADGMADIINAQPKRECCKICGTPLKEAGNIVHSHNIDYIVCDKCGHLNSANEDTDDFASKVYVEDDYSKNYSMKDKENYDRRMNMIYVPKAQFLIDCLKKDGLSSGDIKDLDIGAGCGYFVAAMHSFGIESTGIEVSATEVEHGNAMIGDGKGNYLKHVGLTDSIDYIKNTDANVISAIGVLEHLIHLRENLDAIRDNKNIKYLINSF